MVDRYGLAVRRYPEVIIRNPFLRRTVLVVVLVPACVVVCPAICVWHGIRKTWRELVDAYRDLPDAVKQSWGQAKVEAPEKPLLPRNRSLRKPTR